LIVLALDWTKSDLTNFKYTEKNPHKQQAIYKHPSWIWDHQSFIFKNLPLFDEDKSLVCLGCSD